MKYLLTSLLLLFITNSFGQVYNVKAGVWSDQTLWSNNQVPTVTDDVDLQFDIIVDINAACQSLTLNGYNVTVNTGVNFNIAGTKMGTTLYSFVVLDTTFPAPQDTVSKACFIMIVLKGIPLLNGSGMTITVYNQTTFIYLFSFIMEAIHCPIKEYSNPLT